MPACWRRFSHLHRCHAPRKRGIQYAAAHRLNHDRLGVLDRPVKPGDDTENVRDSGLLRRKGSSQ
ncbi:hypothetical protein E4K64_03875 [Bradyrhizobium frederickii]|uniref:Uncharacterized protein n=1 Tax=Bradyrhizobium frederickii TaxID=2560054 RepID=A0A4Y9PI55_9BRAD|nr:hypothetical protein E4K64_03875 [Bradyrhizobium frederickii]